ncbi:MAG: F0F1 ATP synthase subunit epsilon [Gammaproteobacteria bacterium]
MAATLHIDIVSAEEEIHSGEAAVIYAPAEMGEVGIYPRHTPLLTRLKPGEIRLETPAGEEMSFFVSGGLLEVQPRVVTVLSDTAIRAHDLDEAAAIAAKEKAEQALRDRQSDMDYAKARAELAQAAAQLRMLQGLRKKMR